jgi:hypothetical protein
MLIFEKGFVKHDQKFSGKYLKNYFDYNDQKRQTQDFLLTY